MVWVGPPVLSKLSAHYLHSPRLLLLRKASFERASACSHRVMNPVTLTRALKQRAVAGSLHADDRKGALGSNYKGSLLGCKHSKALMSSGSFTGAGGTGGWKGWAGLKMGPGQQVAPKADVRMTGKKKGLQIPLQM